MMNLEEVILENHRIFVGIQINSLYYEIIDLLTDMIVEKRRERGMEIDERTVKEELMDNYNPISILSVKEYVRKKLEEKYKIMPEKIRSSGGLLHRKLNLAPKEIEEVGKYFEILSKLDKLRELLYNFGLETMCKKYKPIIVVESRNKELVKSYSPNVIVVSGLGRIVSNENEIKGLAKMVNDYLNREENANQNRNILIISENRIYLVLPREGHKPYLNGEVKSLNF